MGYNTQWCKAGELHSHQAEGGVIASTHEHRCIILGAHIIETSQHVSDLYMRIMHTPTDMLAVKQARQVDLQATAGAGTERVAGSPKPFALSGPLTLSRILPSLVNPPYP